MILSGPLLTHFYQTKYLLQLDQEHLLASPSPGYAHLTFPGFSHAIETNSLFLPVFQISSIFTVVGIQCYSHYKYATCLTRVFFLSVILLRHAENVPGFSIHTNSSHLTFHRKVSSFLHCIQVISFY